MADDNEARPSTDETAPLLDDPGWGRNGDNAYQHLVAVFTDYVAAFMAYVTSLVHEPLTALTRALLVVVLVLFLLTSIFIGLFAGAQHNLNLEKGRHDHEVQTVTVTEFATSTCVFPTTTVLTTTSMSVTTTTSYSTTTSISTTTTTAVPIPIPTPPDEVIGTVPLRFSPFSDLETYIIQKPCLSTQCIILSASILSSLDTTQDPCENFYAFANGGWLNSHPLPADKGRFGSFGELSKQNQHLIQKILESDTIVSDSVAQSYDDEILGKLRGLYSSCLDEKTLDAIGMEPLHHFVRTVRQLYRGESTDISQFAKNKGSKGKEHGLTAALSFLHSRGISALFDFFVDGDIGVDPNHMLLWFNQPDFGLSSKEYYNEESIRELYRSVIERLLLALDDNARNQTSQQSATLVNNKERKSVWPPWWPPWGDDDDGDDDDEDEDKRDPVERARDLAKEVVKFESRVANASLDLDILYQDPIATYNRLDITLLAGSLPEVHFTEYFSAFAPHSFPDNVIVTYPAYPVSLSKILSNTSSEVIEAYLVVRSALSLVPYLGLDTEAWKAVRTLDEVLNGIKKGAVGDRAEFCVGQVESALGFAAGRYFANATFGGESREKGTKVITDIIGSFKASLPHIEWMDETSAEAAAQKVMLSSHKADAIRVKVGFPLSPNTTDARSVARYYHLVEIHENQFFKNMLSAAVSDEIKKWAQLGKKRNLALWKMHPSTVNAYFSPSGNEIVFPAGILQPPFFSQHWPTYLSYGAFGHIAAHELTHAFDSAGRLYNQQGKLEQWWTNSTNEGFQARQNCIVKQYSAYTVSDGKGGVLHVNGNLTSGENIGDTGLIQAYRAWRAQYSSSFHAGNEYILPGLNYTKEQLFFIAFGQVWPENIKPASAVQRVRTDPHSPNHYRVDGTLSNIPEFARAFNCPVGARLNPPPEKQCIFW